jgi:hypothetical protein
MCTSVEMTCHKNVPGTMTAAAEPAAELVVEQVVVVVASI